MDPFETKNLWLSPHHTDVKLDLWNKLLEWDAGMERTPDVFSSGE
jgi:hypothetical protein